MNRKKGQRILEGLLEAGLAHIDSIQENERKHFSTFMNLIESTPELNLYSKQMWMRHEKALAGAIRKESKKKISTLEAEAIARFVLDSYHRVMATSNPKASLRKLFDIILVFGI